MDDIVNEMQERIWFLEERLRVIEDLLAPSAVSVPIEWRLTNTEARVFAHLTTRDVVTKESIMAALYSDRANDDPAIKIIDVFVCKMRSKLKPFGVVIETVWGRGYSLKDRHQYVGGGAS